MAQRIQRASYTLAPVSDATIILSKGALGRIGGGLWGNPISLPKFRD